MYFFTVHVLYSLTRNVDFLCLTSTWTRFEGRDSCGGVDKSFPPFFAGLLEKCSKFGKFSPAEGSFSSTFIFLPLNESEHCITFSLSITRIALRGTKIYKIFKKLLGLRPLTHTMGSAKFRYPLQFFRQTYGPARFYTTWIKSNSILLIVCSRLFVFSIFCAVVRCKAVIPRGGARLPVFLPN